MNKKVVLLSELMFIMGFIISGLNYKFNWYILPNFIIVIASIVFVLSYILYLKVLRESAYISRVIEVRKIKK